MRIKSKDMPLILALLENPTSTQQELSDTVKSFADHTWDVSNISRKLSKFFDPKDGILKGVQPIFNLDLLDLELHGYILEVEDKMWDRNISIIENLAKLHPYTSYINKVYGRVNGMYLQFYVPKKTQVGDYITKIMEFLRMNEVIKSFIPLPALDFVISSNGSLGVWDPWTSYWDVDFKTLEDVLNRHYEPHFFPKRRGILRKMKNYDMAVLREMSKDLKKSQTLMNKTIIEKCDDEDGYDPYVDFRKSFPKSKQSLSRKISWLESYGFIKSKWLVFDREKFGLFNQVLFVMDRDESGLKALMTAIETETIISASTTKGEYKMRNKVLPYPCSINANSEKVILWLYLQPVDLLKFTDLFTRRFKGVEFYLLDVNPKSYYFNNRNFIENTHSWRSDPVFVYDDIIYALKLLIHDNYDIRTFVVEK